MAILQQLGRLAGLHHPNVFGGMFGGGGGGGHGGQGGGLGVFGGISEAGRIAPEFKQSIQALKEAAVLLKEAAPAIKDSVARGATTASSNPNQIGGQSQNAANLQTSAQNASISQISPPAKGQTISFGAPAATPGGTFTAAAGTGPTNTFGGALNSEVLGDAARAKLPNIPKGPVNWLGNVAAGSGSATGGLAGVAPGAGSASSGLGATTSPMNAGLAGTEFNRSAFGAVSGNTGLGGAAAGAKSVNTAMAAGEAAGGAGAAGGIGAIGAVAGPIAAVVVGAELLQKGFSQAAESLQQLNATAIALTTGFAKAIGIPDSIANLGGALINLGSPIGMLGKGFEAMSGWVSINPLDKLKAPLDLVKGMFESVAEVGKAFVAVLWDMRDPAKMLSGAMSAFSSQVGKYNPAAVERFQLALDNLSAAAGVIFEPIIEAARQFADELNVLYTAAAPGLREAITQMIPPMMSLGRMIATNLIAAVEGLVPVFQSVMGVFIEVSGAVVELGRSLAGPLMGSFGQIGAAVRPLISAFVDMIPAIAPFVASLFDVASAIGESVIPPLMRFIDPVMQVIRAVGNLYAVFQPITQGFLQILIYINPLYLVFQALSYAVSGVFWALKQLAAASFAAGYALGYMIEHWTDVIRGNFAGVSAAFAQGRQQFLGLFERQEQRQQQQQQITGAVTVAAQQARQVNIEQVGQEARQAAYSQGANIQQQIADNTQRTAAAVERQAQAGEALYNAIGQLIGQGIDHVMAGASR